MTGRHHRPSLAVEVLTATAAAAIATQVKVWAESALQPLGERLFPPSEAERSLRGADPDGHPANMPPQVLVDEVGRAAGQTPSDAERGAASEAVHWVTGVGAGVVYGLLAHRFPAVRAGHGLLFGAGLLAGTHLSVVPALGLQAPLGELPRSWWVWEPGSHLVYGVTTDLLLTAGEALLELR